MCFKVIKFLIYHLLFFVFLSNWNPINAQVSLNDKVTTLHFPYKNDLKITYSSKKIIFDNYNFPKETTLGTLNYNFYDFSEGILKVIYTHNFKKDSFEFTTYLQMTGKGLTYWFGENDSIKLKKNTLAISLPLFKGKKWNTYFNDMKSQVSCISVDTVISTPLGNLHTFAIKHNVIVRSKSTRNIDRHITFTEFYSQEYGKIKMHYLEYGVVKDTKRIIKFKEEEITISTFLKPNLN